MTAHPGKQGHVPPGTQVVDNAMTVGELTEEMIYGEKNAESGRLVRGGSAEGKTTVPRRRRTQHSEWSVDTETEGWLGGWAVMEAVVRDLTRRWCWRTVPSVFEVEWRNLLHLWSMNFTGLFLLSTIYKNVTLDDSVLVNKYLLSCILTVVGLYKRGGRCLNVICLFFFLKGYFYLFMGYARS